MAIVIIANTKSDNRNNNNYSDNNNNPNVEGQRTSTIYIKKIQLKGKSIFNIYYLK